MQRWEWKLDNYLIDFFILSRISGKIKIVETTVIKRLINKSIPIDEVPEWLEIASVEKDPIVVAALNTMAFGVLLRTTFINKKFESIYLLKKYIGKEIPRL